MCYKTFSLKNYKFKYNPLFFNNNNKNNNNNNNNNHRYTHFNPVQFRYTALRGCAEDLNDVVSVRKYDARTTHDGQTN